MNATIFRIGGFWSLALGHLDSGLGGDLMTDFVQRLRDVSRHEDPGFPVLLCEEAADRN
jgi:hypothetical protein